MGTEAWFAEKQEQEETTAPSEFRQACSSGETQLQIYITWYYYIYLYEAASASVAELVHEWLMEGLEAWNHRRDLFFARENRAPDMGPRVLVASLTFAADQVKSGKHSIHAEIELQIDYTTTEIIFCPFFSRFKSDKSLTWWNPEPGTTTIPVESRRRRA